MSDKINLDNYKSLTLPESYKYYIGLLLKWKNWQIYNPEKLIVHQGDRLFFEESINNIASYNCKNLRPEFLQSFYLLANSDIDLNEIIFYGTQLFKFDTSIYSSELIYPFLQIKSQSIKLNKKIVIDDTQFSRFKNDKLKIDFYKTTGILILENKIMNSNNIVEITVDNSFDFIKLINIDTHSFSKKTKNILIDFYYKNNKLELINCNFPELDNIRQEEEILMLRNELETVKNTNVPQEIFDFTQKIPPEYWDAFADYFAGFKGFVLRSKGKRIGMELNVNGDFLFRVYSDEPKDLIGIEQDLKQFLSAVPFFIQNPLFGVNQINKSGKVDPNLMILESQVSALTTQLRMTQAGKIWAEEQNQILFGQISELEIEIDTQTKQNQIFLEYTKPIIFTEGKTDVIYLQAAINLFANDFTLLQNIQIEEIGFQTDGQTKNGGFGKLNDYFKANQNKTAALNSKIILLYDCDANQKFENINNKLFKLGIEINSQNQKYKIGIENLLPQKYFENDSFYSKQTNKNFNTGKIVQITELDKVKLCTHICNQTDTNDFEYFKPLLVKLQQIFTI